MSAEAMGWVYRYSPFEGAAFSVHLAIADSVNDVNADEFWMRAGKLALKARCTRSTARVALAKLMEGGFIESLDPPGVAQREHRPVRYRFLFPDEPVVFDARQDIADQSRRGRSPATKRPDVGHVTQGNPKEPNGLSLALDAVEAAREEPPPKRTRARQPRDDYFDAIVACFGQASTKSREAMYAQVAGELLAAKAEPGQVALAHAELMRRGWENPTPIAMVKHWDDLLESAKPKRRGTNFDKIAERDREVRDGAGSVGAVRRGG